jgi:two-component system, NarL family, sensor histidine kinase UhpB
MNEGGRVPGKKKPSRSKGFGVTAVHLAQDPELSRQLLRAEEEERKRISRELHDETGQGLMVLRMYLQTLTSEFAGGGGHAPEKFQEAFDLLDRTIEGLRRIIRRLSPRVLEELGLVAAIRKEVRELGRTNGIKAALELPEALTLLDHESEIAIYRIVQEALHNVAKHSEAKHLRLQVSRGASSVRIVIEDDGVGFSVRRGQSGQGFGLLGMRERVAALGGTVRIRSPKTKGTRISVTLPMDLKNSGGAARTTHSLTCEQTHGAV